mgnify:CR=1 FL=1
MDLYAHENNMIKMMGQMRYDQANAHNERVTAMRRESARDILTAKQGTQNEVAEENTEEMAKGGVASISTAIDANSARNALKQTIKDRAEKAVRNQVKSSISSVAEKIDKPHDVPHDSRTLTPMTESAEETEGMARRVAKGSIRSRVSLAMEEKMATRIGKAGLKSAGSMMNVGMGVEALAHDFKGGQFHLAGKNGLEEASNGLQIASGVADIVGLAFPPVLAIGMLLGAASSVTGAIGEQEEVDAKEKQQKQKSSDFISQSKASVAGLRKVDANRARATAEMKLNNRNTREQTRTTQKVSG